MNTKWSRHPENSQIDLQATIASVTVQFDKTKTKLSRWRRKNCANPSKSIKQLRNKMQNLGIQGSTKA